MAVEDTTVAMEERERKKKTQNSIYFVTKAWFRAEKVTH